MEEDDNYSNEPPAPPPVSISLPHSSDDQSTLVLASSTADTVTGIFIIWSSRSSLTQQEV